MQTKTYNVYKYDELTKEQKEKVLENYSYINLEHNWHQLTFEEETARLQELGYNNATIYYSGFWLQGDGASFTATGNIEKLVPKKLRKFVDNITFSKSHQYEHEFTMSVQVDYNNEPTGNIQPVEFNNLEEKLLENARKEARVIYERLQKEYEYLTSREAIEETICANDYNFTEYSKID